jgi:diguanylate cyclase (GGDEF)-like protein/PAS domain S-box-containing protein
MSLTPNAAVSAPPESTGFSFMSALTPEKARLAALYQYPVLDATAEPQLDQLTALAAEICETPVACLNLVAEERVWHKARFGWDDASTPRGESYCSLTIEQPEYLLVPDVLHGPPHAAIARRAVRAGLRFYAGVPLCAPGGEAIGTLAVMDKRPRELSAAQLQMLGALASAAMAHLELKRQGLAFEQTQFALRQAEERVAQYERLLGQAGRHGNDLARTNDLLRQKVSEHEVAIQALEEAGQRYALAARSARVGVWDWDVAAGEIYFCSRFTEILGCEREDLVLSPEEWFERVHPDDLDALKREIEPSLNGEATQFENEHRLRRVDGEYLWVLVRGLAEADARGRVVRLAGSLMDITARKEAEQKLYHNAFHDALTGLPNRTLFMDRLKRSLGRARHSHDYQFAVLFLDLDRFKVINDSLGHQVGDALLIAIARRLEACLRPGDMVARLAGDEFAIFIDHLKQPTDATHAADRLLAEMAQPFNLDGREVFASASIGVALSQAAYERAEDFMRDADTAMYHAKNRGRGRLELFDSDMHARVTGLLQLEMDLRRALTRGELRVLYQPIIALQERQVRGFEALLRWDHPQQGLISPAKFMPVAEDTGLVIALDQWVLREAGKTLSAWQAEFPLDKPLKVSVNLSGKQFAQPDLCEKVTEALAGIRVAPRSLTLEITESSLVSNPEAAAVTLRQLRESGFTISLDDFGTGYSSLSYLHRFPIDILKIDQSFVAQMNLSKNAEIVRAIITLANNLGMDVIAEGVETSEQVMQLLRMNCSHVQGYLFSKPITREAVRELLAQTYPKTQKPQPAAA